MTSDQPGAGVRQQLAVDAIDTHDLAILVVTQGRPVEAGRANRPAVTLCVREVVRVRRAVDEHLFRHTAEIDAGTAELPAFGNRDTRAEARGNTRRTTPAGTGAEDKQAEVEDNQRSRGSEENTSQLKNLHRITYTVYALTQKKT